MTAPFRNATVGLVVGALVLVLGVATMLRSTTTREITIMNTSDYELTVDIATGDSNNWTPLTTVRPGESDTVKEVADRASDWTFRFHSAGINGGTLRLSRADLEGLGWVVEPPASVSTKFASEGVPAAPRREGAGS